MIIGSSPLVRGQLIVCTFAVNNERIIPARAGPTCQRRFVVEFIADHPRSCGANMVSTWAAVW